jgi:hypothetical protein
MGKVIGILLFVVAIWLGLRALEGESLFAMPTEADPAAVRPAQRVGERVQQSIDLGAERTEALLPE